MHRVICLLLLITINICWAQTGGDPQLVYEIITDGACPVGVRGAGMGGAQIASAEDGSAIWNNPALLYRVGRTEFSGSLIYSRFFNESSLGLNPAGNSDVFQLNSTKVGSLWGVFPIASRTGAMALGIGISRVNDFNRILRFETEPGWWLDQSGPGFGGGEDDRGGIYSYSAAFGAEISQRVSLGLGLEILDGSDDYVFRFDSIENGDYYNYQRQIDNDYSGYSGRLGFGYSASDFFYIGAIVRFPTSITVEQALSEYEEFNGESDRTYQAGKYRFVLPFKFGIGGAWTFRNLLLTSDLNYCDYTQMEYRTGVDRFRANTDIKRYYRDVLSISIGAEYSVPGQGISFRAGVRHEPLAFKYLSNDHDPITFTGGASFLLSRNLKADLAFSFSRWQTHDRAYLEGTTGMIPLTAKYRTNELMFSLSYRI